MYAFSGLARDKDLQSSTVNIKVLSFSKFLVLFQNVLSFSKCERFCECCFSFFWKSQLWTKICTLTTNSFTYVVVNKQQNVWIKLLNLFQLSMIYSASYLFFLSTFNCRCLAVFSLFWIYNLYLYKTKNVPQSYIKAE